MGSLKDLLLCLAAHFQTSLVKFFISSRQGNFHPPYGKQSKETDFSIPPLDLHEDVSLDMCPSDSDSRILP